MGKGFYNKNRPMQVFNIGDLVQMRLAHAGTSADGKRKFTARWIGPFKVIQSLSTDVYEIDMGKLQLHPVFHTSFLKPYNSRDDSAVDTPVEVALEMDQKDFLSKLLLVNDDDVGLQSIV